MSLAPPQGPVAGRGLESSEPVRRPLARRGNNGVEALPDATGALDPIADLSALAADLSRLEGNGLADRLLAWLAPQPHRLEVLSQQRVVPLLGAAADLIARA